MALSLPDVPTRNERQLAQWRQERFTGLTGTTVALSQAVDQASGLLLVWKNGTLVDPSTVTLSGQTVTLGSSLVSGDVVVAVYKARI